VATQRNRSAGRRRTARRGRASPGSRGAKGRGGRRGTPRRRSIARSFWRVTGLLLFGLGVVGGFVTARLVVQMDAIVTERFEGRLFRVPSKVLSAPTILYPGLDWKQIDLRGTLRRLGYREAPSAQGLALGRYAWRPGRLTLHRRPFDHPSRAEPARLISLRLEGGIISEIRDVQTRREVGAVLLEPELVGSYYGPDHEQRELVKLADVPPHLIAAILSVEDQRFREHGGIDWRRIGGALLANLRAGGIAQGGSTLTQQLAKNFFLTPERKLWRKIQEATMAVIMEARYDKDLILEAYLNEIYMGQRGGTAIHGVGEAAHFYFGHGVRDLAVHESALLAALIQSPNALSPHRQPDRARKRRDLVLQLMREQGRIGEGAYQRAVAKPLRVAAVTPEPREGRYFLDALQRQLPEFYDTATLSTEGLQIYSTLDLRLQRAASAALTQELGRLEKAHASLAPQGGEQLQGCIVALRPQTGEVLALVGGRSYAKSQFDRCTQARRPAGSVFKPFVYLAALESGVLTLGDWIDDAPLEVAVPGGSWKPRNFDRKFHGRVPARTALEKSYNVAAARLGQRVGIDRVVKTARALGIRSPLPRVPSLAIGAADLSPLEVARAYATLANGGIRPRIRTFEDVVEPAGGTVERQPIGFDRVIDAGTAYLATSLLQGVVDRGTAASIRRRGFTGAIAGKTGTSNDYKDAWFVGFTPELVVAVWVGFDTPRNLRLASSSLALPVWARFMKEVTGGHVRGDFLRPPEVVELEIEPETGALALAGCPERRREFYLRGTEPAQTCPEWGRPPRRDGDGGSGGFFDRFFDGLFGEP